jgi:hypothetical protein
LPKAISYFARSVICTAAARPDFTGLPEKQPIRAKLQPKTKIQH